MGEDGAAAGAARRPVSLHPDASAGLGAPEALAAEIGAPQGPETALRLAAAALAGLGRALSTSRFLAGRSGWAMLTR